VPGIPARACAGPRTPSGSASSTCRSMRRTTCLPTTRARTAHPRRRRSSWSRGSPCSALACGHRVGVAPRGVAANRRCRRQPSPTSRWFRPPSGSRRPPSVLDCAARPSTTPCRARPPLRSPPAPTRFRRARCRTPIPTPPCPADESCRVSFAPGQARPARHPEPVVEAVTSVRPSAWSPARRPAARTLPGWRGTKRSVAHSAPNRRSRAAARHPADDARVIKEEGGGPSSPREMSSGERQAVSSPSGARSNFATASAPSRPCGSIDAGR
jgi:hypothetical protein